MAIDDQTFTESVSTRADKLSKLLLTRPTQVMIDEAASLLVLLRDLRELDRHVNRISRRPRTPKCFHLASFGWY